MTEQQKKLLSRLIRNEFESTATEESELISLALGIGLIELAEELQSDLISEQIYRTLNY
jgi:hypothetical protein